MGEIGSINMIKKLLIVLMLLSLPVYAAEVTIPTTYATGSTVTASNLNGNFTAITAQVNGGLDNDNANTTQGYHFFETKSTLPSAGSQGRVVFQTSDNTLNLDTGAAWLSAVAPSGTLATGKIAVYSSGWTLLTPGTSAYPLVSNGTSSVPSYQILPITGGGTGQVTAQAAVDALLPSQASASGKYLTSNGSASSWSSIAWVPTNIQVFTGNGTWTKPAGIGNVYVKVWGSGGGGGDNVTPGSAGATSSFAGTTTIQATGGGFGSNAVAGAGGVGSNGIINLTGQTGKIGNNFAGGNPPMGIGFGAPQASLPVIGFAYGGMAATANGGSGGAGGYSEGYTAVTGNVAVTVGAAGGGGGGSGGAGGGGYVIVYY